MQHRSLYRTRDKPLAAVGFACAGLFGVGTVAVTPCVRADAVAHLVSVAVCPGHNFANAGEALSYGYAMCDKVSAGRSYAQVVGDVKADFNTPVEYQASYLISRAVNEPCPALIWQMRRSPAHHRPPVTAGG